MPLQATSGAASYDAFGGGVPAAPQYIEDFFQTWLYTGNGGTQTITNGIDISGRGGLVWCKSRSTPGYSPDNMLFDTLRGPLYPLYSNETSAPGQYGSTLTAFNSNGFSLGVNLSQSSVTYASWTFREQPKFFDVVTYTGTGVSRTVSHNLGSVPGCIMVKRTSSGGTFWRVYHRGMTSAAYAMQLNAANPEGSSQPNIWDSTAPTSTVFSVGTDASVNQAGQEYVAYIYAHNAGGFGPTGADNAISCGSFTADSGGNATVNLGYEPQWLLVKSSTNTDNWIILDTMRGWDAGGTANALLANSQTGEVNYSSSSVLMSPIATGFGSTGGWFVSNQSYIYIAIRRGPMKVPTTGTSVYNAVNVTGLSSPNRRITGFGFPLDLLLSAGRTGTYLDKAWNMRLTNAAFLRSTSTAPPSVQFLTLADFPFAYQDGYQTGIGENTQYYWNNNGDTYVQYGFRRAPSFFDVVCFPTAGSRETNLRVNHNLAAVPELIIVKARSTANWVVYTGSINQSLILNSTTGISTVANTWGASAPTISDFGLDTFYFVNTYGNNMVAYLFASCPGVSKVGSFTGTGATQVINCGFTGGARFVLIKATSTTGSWYVWDSARGIVAGDDPYLLLNSTTAEVTTTDWVDAAATGFELSNAGGNLVNTNGVSYIFLAIS